jgi:nucleolar protein 14
MTPEERMLERFTKERQRASKGSSFNLDDEDELTHYGQSLSKLDDFDGAGLALDDEDEDASGQIDSRTVKSAHFGGFGEDEGDDNDDEEVSSDVHLVEMIVLTPSPGFSQQGKSPRPKSWQK